MGRVFLTIIVPLLLPTALYAAWRGLVGKQINIPAVWIWLAVVGPRARLADAGLRQRRFRCDRKTGNIYRRMSTAAALSCPAISKGRRAGPQLSHAHQAARLGDRSSEPCGDDRAQRRCAFRRRLRARHAARSDRSAISISRRRFSPKRSCAASPRRRSRRCRPASRMARSPPSPTRGLTRSRRCAAMSRPSAARRASLSPPIGKRIRRAAISR